MSDNIQRIVIELAARGIGAALRAAQSIKRVADQSLPLRGRGVSSVFSGRFGRGSIQQTWPNAKLRSPLLSEEGGTPTDLGGVGENAVRLFRVAMDEDRLVSDLSMSLPEEARLLTRITRFPFDETSVASVPAVFPMTDSDLSQSSIDRQSRAGFQSSREVVTNIDSTALPEFWIPGQVERKPRRLSRTANEKRPLNQQHDVSVWRIGEERTTRQERFVNSLDPASASHTRFANTNNLIDSSRQPYALSHNQIRQERIRPLMTVGAPVGVSQEAAQGVVSHQWITPSSPLTPSWQLEGLGEEIHRLAPTPFPPSQFLATQFDPVDLQDDTTRVSRFPNAHREQGLHELPLEFYEARSQSLNEQEKFSEISSEALLDPHGNDHYSLHQPSSSAVPPGVLQTNHLALRRRKPEHVPSIEMTQTRVATGPIDADDSDRPTPSVAPLQSVPSEIQGHSESVGVPFLSNDMEARLESMFRLQEERFKSMIKNLAYWLK